MQRNLINLIVLACLVLVSQAIIFNRFNPFNRQQAYEELIETSKDNKFFTPAQNANTGICARTRIIDAKWGSIIGDGAEGTITFEQRKLGRGTIVRGEFKNLNRRNRVNTAAQIGAEAGVEAELGVEAGDGSMNMAVFAFNNGISIAQTEAGTDSVRFETLKDSYCSTIRE